MQPNMAIAASFAPPTTDFNNGVTAAMAGAATPAYNVGLGFYFLVWGIVNFSFFLCSFRM
jgi:hypothetical protein